MGRTKRYPAPARVVDGEASIRKGRENAASIRGQVRRTHGAIYSPQEMFKISIEERVDNVLQLACYKVGADLQWQKRAYFGEGFATVQDARDFAEMVMYSGKWPLMNLFLTEEGTDMSDMEDM